MFQGLWQENKMTEFTLDIYKDNSGLWAFRASNKKTKEILSGVRSTQGQAREAGEKALKELGTKNDN